MAGQKEKQRFLFFKYVPPKKGDKPLKDEEYSKKIGAEAPEAEGLGQPDYDVPETECWDCPQEPECPEIPEIPEFPDFPECPDLPELPECPEIPDFPEPPVSPCPEDSMMHVIQAGDTFWKLAKRYGTSVESIVVANPDVDPLNLQIGETICIPMGIPGAKG